MATENLDLVISVLDRFTAELDQLLLKLAEVDAAAEAVEDITIDVDVRGEHKIDRLIAKMAALGLMDAKDLDVNVRGIPAGRGGGGGAALGGGIAIGGVAQAAGDASDSLTDAAKSAGQMADVAEDATEAIDLTNIRMSDLHNLLAALVPLLLVFIGAVPALLGALVALAAAAIAAAAGLAALAGFGALGFALARAGPDNLMEGFSEIIDEITEDFLDAFAPLAERLAPLFERALDGLDRLFQGIADRGDVLVAFSQTAQAFGAFMQDFLPDLLADMGEMARAFGPFFGELMDVFDFSVLGALTEFMAQAADDTILFMELLIPFLAVIGEMSIGFLRVVNAIGLLLQGFFQILNLLPISAEAWGVLIASILTAATVMFLASKMAAIAAVGITGLTAAVGSLITVLAPLLLLSVAVFAIANHFDLLGTNIEKATRSLREFNRLGKGMRRNPFFDPNLQPGQVRRGRGSGVGSINVTVEGNADEEVIREQTGNAMYRMERRGRGR